MARKTVLVTGMSGLIGSAVHRHLGEKYELSAVNRRSIPGVPCHRADISDLKAILLRYDDKTNVRLLPFDQIYVGESRQARVDKWFPPWLRPALPCLSPNPAAPPAAAARGPPRW